MLSLFSVEKLSIESWSILQEHYYRIYVWAVRGLSFDFNMLMDSVLRHVCGIVFRAYLLFVYFLHWKKEKDEEETAEYS